MAVDSEGYSKLLGDYEILRDKVVNLESGLDAIRDTTNTLTEAQRGTAADVEEVKREVTRVGDKVTSSETLLQAIAQKLGVNS